MGIKQWAGERLAGLGDNALTRSWRGSVDRVIAPIERRVISDDDLKSALAVKFGGMNQEEGGFTDEQLKMLERMNPAAMVENQRMVDRMRRVVDAEDSPTSRDVYAQSVANMFLGGAQLNRDALNEIAGMLPRGAGPMTGGGEMASQVLGHPAAAYGAVTAGGALAVKGALDVMARLQAGEPVSEEEAGQAYAALAANGMI